MRRRKKIKAPDAEDARFAAQAAAAAKATWATLDGLQTRLRQCPWCGDTLTAAFGATHCRCGMTPVGNGK